jgi:hypothetical protein
MQSPEMPYPPIDKDAQALKAQSSGKLIEVLGKMTVDEMFSDLEQRAKEGCMEHVTFEMVGMNDEDVQQ